MDPGPPSLPSPARVGISRLMCTAGVCTGQQRCCCHSMQGFANDLPGAVHPRGESCAFGKDLERRGGMAS